MYLISVWGGEQQYLLKVLQVQQQTVDRAVFGFFSRCWSKSKLLEGVGCLSLRQLIFLHNVLQAQETIIFGKPADLYESILTQHPYRIRNATGGRFRFGEQFCGESGLVAASFKHRAEN